MAVAALPPNEHSSSSTQYEKVAKELFEQGHYFAEHPIGV